MTYKEQRESGKENDMGVYIPNIKMPNACWDCFYSKNCGLIPRWLTDEQSHICATRRIDNCPLIEIDQEDEEAVLTLALMRKAMREGKSLREFLDGERRDESDKQEEWLDFREEQEFNERWGKE